ncbi:MAG: hypothetical protein ACK2UW_03115 [Anaerolineales bacterium]|jgi:hypothetical protein
MKPIHKLILLLLLFWLPALACNFPGLGSGADSKFTVEDLRATLAASTPLVTPVLPEETIPAPPELPTSGPPLVPAQPLPGETYAYTVHSGDTAPALAGRFGLSLSQVPLPPGQDPEGYLTPGEILRLPAVLETVTTAAAILPDSEVVYSPSAADFDVDAFVWQAGGYLSTYHETVDDKDLSGAEIIQRVADDLSVNPRLLLALLEFRAGWVFGQPLSGSALDYPIGFYIPDRRGLYQEIQVAATQLNVGYYGWRAGSLVDLHFQGGPTGRMNPVLNPGTAALQHLFALLYPQADWELVLYGPDGFRNIFTRLMGDPWQRAAAVEPMIPAGLAQPDLELPFAPGERWSLTAGPHPAWNAGTPRGALDFSPVTGGAVCDVSPAWATAAAAGVIARADDYAVLLDLDGDGTEQTGWVLLYYHLADINAASAGTRVALDAPLGHPSCYGGRATGKHVHLARKYNGEWLPADGPLPFTLSGWRTVADPRNYYGLLEKEGQIVSANPSGSQTSIIMR